MASVLVDHAALRAFAAQCFEAVGAPEDAAATTADALVQADLWGHQSHGVMRLFWYADRISSGAVDPSPALAAAEGRPAFATLDARDALGPVAARAAMNHAIERARAFGIGAVAVRNSNHFGTAMYFTRRAARAGCVGFLSTNASPAMAPWGGREKRVGTNPWSWAAPAGRFAPMMLDISNTAVARGKLYLARQRGAEIPLGWAVDASGAHTTDPDAGIAGTILPMAGHKGYAVAVVMDMLSGVLAGGRFGDAIVGPYVADGASGAGHLAIAIDVAASRPLAEFEADMERLISDLKATPKADGVDEIFYPGEIEAVADAEGRRAGIALPAATASMLVERAGALGVEAPF